MYQTDDADLVTAFEALAIAPSAFTHREHVRLAFAMLNGADFGGRPLKVNEAQERDRSGGGGARSSR